MNQDELNKMLLQSYITSQMTVAYLGCIPNGKNKSFNKQRAKAIDALNKVMKPIDDYLKKDGSMDSVMDDVGEYISILEDAILEKKPNNP